MRKGYVMIICRDELQRDYLFNYIADKLNDNIIAKSIYQCSDYLIEVNGYMLLFKIRYPENMKGYRPEIVYIDKWADISIDDAYNLVEVKVICSNRKTPIRYCRLDDGMIIDLKELTEDDYARSNTCNIERVKEWEKKYE